MTTEKIHPLPPPPGNTEFVIERMPHSDLFPCGYREQQQRFREGWAWYYAGHALAGHLADPSADSWGMRTVQRTAVNLVEYMEANPVFTEEES